MVKDISGWAANATTTPNPAHDDHSDDDPDQPQEGEMDWAALADVLKRGRRKDRIEQLHKLTALAARDGSCDCFLLPVAPSSHLAGFFLLL